MSSTPVLGCATRRPGAASTPVLVDLEQFWPSRRCHAFDELCS